MTTNNVNVNVNVNVRSNLLKNFVSALVSYHKRSRNLFRIHNSCGCERSSLRKPLAEDRTHKSCLEMDHLFGEEELSG